MLSFSAKKADSLGEVGEAAEAGAVERLRAFLGTHPKNWRLIIADFIIDRCVALSKGAAF